MEREITLRAANVDADALTRFHVYQHTVRRLADGIELFVLKGVPREMIPPDFVMHVSELSVIQSLPAFDLCRDPLWDGCSHEVKVVISSISRIASRYRELNESELAREEDWLEWFDSMPTPP